MPAPKLIEHRRKGVCGFHLVVAPDPDIDRTVTALHDRFRVEYVAPGHCTGEPAFAALKKAFGDHYIYAGLGTTLTATQVGNHKQKMERRLEMVGPNFASRSATLPAALRLDARPALAIARGG
jgi:hypothetical protein